MVKECNLETGVCEIAANNDSSKNNVVKTKDATVFYVGDPMCSWCWGIAPTLKELEKYCMENNIKFKIIVGGLRAGGGDVWNSEFKSFLKKEWSHIQQITGQPFGFKLLEEKFFNYDTEPACRAVVVSSELIDKLKIAKENKLEFFSKVQRKFYTLGQDPKDVHFYEDICLNVGICFNEFKEEFFKKENVQKTHDEFMKARVLNVRGFPSLVLAVANKHKLISSGFITKEKAFAKIGDLLKEEA